ncbi:hypothetical protein [Risungbinella massiliensis]|uniref:hypothetical protein n=1 Tax=Risungbinella massiliensis TaxID=1329796 RepID=UPI00069C9A6C|nr:hypothetical protein [Risungbinella massiliensis]
MKKYLFTALWGVFVWLSATLFFVFFGKNVLFITDSKEFIISIILLEAGTAILLWDVTYL